MLRPSNQTRAGKVRLSRDGRIRRRKKRRRAERASRKKKPDTSMGSPPWKVRRMPKHLSIAESLDRDLRLPVRNPNRYYSANERAVVVDIGRLPVSYTGFCKPGIYSSNELCHVRTKKRDAAFNKTAKVFGVNPTKDRHWSALLRCIICTGYNRADFRSIMRIMDLRTRGCYRAYKKAITSFIACLPRKHMVRALPHGQWTWGGVKDW